ncbi:hypothetical protein [Mycolicibacterium anyangense]|nr:hypothetical protein [Mycolicibacterium anyangense]
MNNSNTVAETVQVGRLSVTTHRVPAAGQLCFAKASSALCFRAR